LEENFESLTNHFMLPEMGIVTSISLILTLTISVINLLIS